MDRVWGDHRSIFVSIWYCQHMVAYSAEREVNHLRPWGHNTPSDLVVPHFLRRFLSFPARDAEEEQRSGVVTM